MSAEAVTMAGLPHVAPEPLSTADLAELLDRLPGLDVGVPDTERIDQIGLLESIKAAAAGAQARASVAFAESQREQRAAQGVPARERSRGLSAQVALARRESPHRGSRHLGLAEALVRELPRTFEHLRAGRVSEWRATVVCRETACLSTEDRATVDLSLADELPTLGDREVEARARALACQLDNAAMAKRAARAERERCVTLRPAPDTMTYLSALLPVAQGVAAFAALDRAAAAATAAGDERTRDQLMADLLVERITGQASAEAVPVEVQLVMPADSLFADGGEPARFAGSTTAASGRPSGAGAGPVLPAAFARTVLRTCTDAGASAWVRRLFTAPDGADLVAMDSRRRVFDRRLRAVLVARDQTCRTPWCDAPIRHADHVRRARDGGETSDTNGQGLCEACNYAKEAPGWTATTVHAGPSPGKPDAPPHTVRTTTPTGHTYESTAPPVLPSRTRGATTTVVELACFQEWLGHVIDAA